MKILVMFTDMVRANRLTTFNESAIRETVMDKVFHQMGGRAFVNCFTPGPDTARGISAFTTGLPPYLNGCDIRLKWPRYFLKPSINTVYDLFIQRGYKISMLSDPRERATGLFPQHISEMNVHNKDRYDIDDFLRNLVLEEKHFVFLSLPQFHWTLDALGASRHGEKQALNDLANAFERVFANIDKDAFDHIFVFSDHGFKFSYEVATEPNWMLLNQDRTNNILLHREKYDTTLVKDDKLCSLADLYSTFEYILSGTDLKPSPPPIEPRSYVVVEDHIKFLPEVNQNIELWAVITESLIYVRSLTEAHSIDRKSGGVSSGENHLYDKILINESSYGRYKEEYDNTFFYNINLLNSVGNDYDELYDFRRKQRPTLVKNFFKAKDILVRRLSLLFSARRKLK